MENNKYHILIVEDDKEIRDGVEIYLKNHAADPVFLYAFRWSVHRPLYHKSTVCVKF